MLRTGLLAFSKPPSRDRRPRCTTVAGNADQTTATTAKDDVRFWYASGSLRVKLDGNTP
jgi:hypothetical protein